MHSSRPRYEILTVYTFEKVFTVVGKTADSSTDTTSPKRSFSKEKKGRATNIYIKWSIKTLCVDP